jgi:hypothetical protein
MGYATAGVRTSNSSNSSASTAYASRNFSHVIPTMTYLVPCQGQDPSLPRVFYPKSVTTGITLVKDQKLCSAWRVPRR